MKTKMVLPESPPAPDFRTHLQRELVRRCKQNPRYSLRAFASFLGISSSALSKILNGKRRVSRPSFEKLARRLGLSPDEHARLIPGQLTRGGIRYLPASGSAEAQPVAQYAQLTLDLFQVVADWYHYAILELTQVRHFKSDPKWVAKTLGITVSEVHLAVERLVRLEMLKIDPSGRWIDDSGAVTNIQTDFTAIALRTLQRQVLEKALTALEEIPVEHRDQTSMTMAIHSPLLNEAKERIKNFRRELCAFLKSKQPLDQVYHLGISLYPLTCIERTKKQ